MKDIEKLLNNSITNRIVKFLCERKRATTLEIVESLADVSKATLYRYVKEMTDFGIIEVVDEVKVKGQVERTYAIKQITISSSEETNNYMVSVVLYLQQIYRQYDLYFNHGKADTKNDKLFMVSPNLLLNDSEYLELCEKIKELVTDYSDRDCNFGRRARNLYIMSAPDERWEEN